MKKLLLLTVTALTLTASGVWAADNAPQNAPSDNKPAVSGPAEHGERDWTLEEARKKAHEHAEKLDKMSEADYSKYQQKRHEYREKTRDMTPEQKEEFYRQRREMHEKHAEKRDERKNGEAGANPGTQPTQNK